MIRLIAIATFIMGGLAAELAHPVQCMLLSASPVRVKRRGV
ncbi:hypothetical protein [Trinickia symbiotica]|nr:hypothetical protein [Trinickia symbiotica]